MEEHHAVENPFVDPKGKQGIDQYLLQMLIVFFERMGEEIFLVCPDVFGQHGFEAQFPVDMG